MVVVVVRSSDLSISGQLHWILNPRNSTLDPQCRLEGEHSLTYSLSHLAATAQVSPFPRAHLNPTHSFCYQPSLFTSQPSYKKHKLSSKHKAGYPDVPNPYYPYMRVGSVVRRSIFIVLAGEVGASSIGCEYLMLLTVSEFG